MKRSLFNARAGAVLTIAAAIAGAHVADAQTRTPPRHEADVNWPKPLPNRWVLGGLGGVCVDAQDHVFILNRQDVLEGELNTGRLAPPIIEFDPEGNVVNSWGDPALLAPRLHSCHVDKDNNIWIASAPSGMVQKYTHDGSRMLLQIGKKGVVDSSDGTVKGKPLNSNGAIFFMPSSIHVDRQNGDVYVSDGEGAGGNRRIAVIDSSGKFLRQWQPDGMETVHCMAIGRDGLVYVCNRNGSRIQVYDKMGVFKRAIQVPWTPVTPPSDGKTVPFGGSAVAIDFSPDQNLIFVINQNNAQIEIIDRESGKVIGNFGRSGNFPGQFNQPHGIAVDSKGNIYIAENRGRRVHKFKAVPPVLSAYVQSEQAPAGPSQAAAVPAAAAPAPPPQVAPSGPPAHAVDVMIAEGVAVFGGPWRNMDARIVEAPPRPNAGAWKVSYDLQPKAGDANFDDSSWPMIDAKALNERRGGGGVFMTWYRINLTIPPRIGDFDTAGAVAVFHIVVDDYAEVWVNGQLPRAVGKPSGSMVAGFNMPNRAVLSDAVKPGEKIQIAVLGINAPISLAPLNPVFVREARVEFYK